MRFLIYIFFNIFLINILYADNIGTLNINIKDIKSNKGDIYLSICPKDVFEAKEEKKDYSKCPKFEKRQVSASENYSFTFKNIPFGEWAIFGYVDENLNGIMDSNFIGIPKEPIIFIKKIKRKPTFEDIKIVVNQDNQDITVIAY